MKIILFENVNPTEGISMAKIQFQSNILKKVSIMYTIVAHIHKPWLGVQ